MPVPSFSAPAAAPAVRAPAAGRAVPPGWLRAAFLAGGAAAVAGAVALGSGSPAAAAGDPELARLLRSMALLKATIVVAAGAVVAWRLGHPIPVRTAAVYLAGTWAMAAASVLVWQLARLPLAAAAFHLGGLAVLAAAAWDGGTRLGRRAPIPS